MTYDELVVNIRRYMETDSNVLSDSVINTFILMTENKILRDIDLEIFRQNSLGNLTANNRFLTMPIDILTHRYMLVKNGDEETFLDFRDVSYVKEYWKDQTDTGFPKYYSVWDQNTFYVAPTPNASFTAEMGYIYRPAQLSSTNTTTWISNNAPEALLYACLIQAYSYTKGPKEMMDYFRAAYQEALQGLGNEQQGRRRRDEYRDGMLRIPLKSESPGP